MTDDDVRTIRRIVREEIARALAARPSTERSAITVGPVAQLLGLTPQGVHLLDAELQPIRSGRIRLYDPRIVERVRKQRAAKRNTR